MTRAWIRSALPSLTVQSRSNPSEVNPANVPEATGEVPPIERKSRIVDLDIARVPVGLADPSGQLISLPTWSVPSVTPVDHRRSVAMPAAVCFVVQKIAAVPWKPTPLTVCVPVPVAFAKTRCLTLVAIGYDTVCPSPTRRLAAPTGV